MTLYGVRVRETPEDIVEREIRKGVRLILPELFGGKVSSYDFCSYSNFLNRRTGEFQRM